MTDYEALIPPDDDECLLCGGTQQAAVLSLDGEPEVEWVTCPVCGEDDA